MWIEPAYQAIPQLPAGQVGTILKIYAGDMDAGDTPRYLVAFADLQGRTYAMATLQAHEILALHYDLSLAS